MSHIPQALLYALFSCPLERDWLSSSSCILLPTRPRLQLFYEGGATAFLVVYLKPHQTNEHHTKRAVFWKFAKPDESKTFVLGCSCEQTFACTVSSWLDVKILHHAALANC